MEYYSMLLVGAYEHTIDDKNRLTLPAKFRDAFKDGIVLTRGMDGCVFVYTPDQWQRLVQGRLERLDPLSHEARRMQRFFYAGGAEAELDRQGRIMIPAALMDHAKLRRDVVVAGVSDHLEVWDREAWRRELKEVKRGAEDVAERLAAKLD